MAETSNKNDKNSGKPYAIIFIVIALSGVVASTYSSVKSEVENVERRMVRMEERIQGQLIMIDARLEAHAALRNHPWEVLAEIKALEEKLTEIETQFDNINERTYEMKRDAKEDIEHLKERLYDEIERLQDEIEWLKGYHRQKNDGALK